MSEIKTKSLETYKLCKTEHKEVEALHATHGLAYARIRLDEHTTRLRCGGWSIWYAWYANDWRYDVVLKSKGGNINSASLVPA